jgi:hypothetical protein
MALIEDVEKYTDEIKQEFGVNTTIAYTGVSMSQLSIARHYGGCKVQGKHFVYNPVDDSLIREDVVKWIGKRKKQGCKDEERTSATMQDMQKNFSFGTSDDLLG